MSDAPAFPWDSLAGSSSRTPRALETRERTQTRRVWTPVQLLPDPEPEDGFTFKWIRNGVHNEPDHNTYQKALREGWEPVYLKDHPELALAITPQSREAGIIEIGHLVLCKMPTEMVEQRRHYYAKHNYAQLDAAEHQYMADNGDDRMGKFATVTGNARVVFGGPQQGLRRTRPS